MFKLQLSTHRIEEDKEEDEEDDTASIKDYYTATAGGGDGDLSEKYNTSNSSKTVTRGNN